MKRQEHLAKPEEVAIRVRVENLKNSRFLGTSPDVPGLVAEGRSVAETVEIAQGLPEKSRNPAVSTEIPSHPSSAVKPARSPSACVCLLDGAPRRDFLPGSRPSSPNIWFSI